MIAGARLGRCRMHGGAKGSGAPFGTLNGAYRDGAHTNEMIALRKLVGKLTR